MYVIYRNGFVCIWLCIYDVSLTFNENKCVHMNLYNRCDIAAFIVVRENGSLNFSCILNNAPIIHVQCDSDGSFPIVVVSVIGVLVG